jgi:hypothetical protein
MAVFSGADIVRSGLIFQYDMGNVQRSWKGAPTTNLLPQPLSFETGYTKESWTTGNIIDNDQIAPNNTKTATRIDRVSGYLYKRNTSSPTFTISPGQTITFSCWIKKLDNTNQNGRGIYIWCYNGAGSGNRATATQEVFNDIWVRQSVIYTALSGETDFSFGFVGAISTHLQGSIAIWRPQVEITFFPSPFVNGTRSNTQAILDLTNKNILTANNLTYNANNTFEFSSGSISIPFSNEFDFSKEQTIVMWMKPGTGSNSARRNPYNQAYGGSGTITHEPNQTFNYYFGTHGGNSTPYVGRTSPFTVAPNELAFVAVTRNQDTNTVRWYKNGILLGTQNAGGYAETNNGNSPITIGTGYTTNFIGDLPSMLVYKKELSPQEIQQNFEATRSRYGI